MPPVDRLSLCYQKVLLILIRSQLPCQMQLFHRIAYKNRRTHDTIQIRCEPTKLKHEMLEGNLYLRSLRPRDEDASGHFPLVIYT